MLPNIDICNQLVRELRDANMLDHDIHLVARDDVPLDDIHQASALQKTELSHGLELGLGIGGIAGLLGGLLTVAFPPAGIALGGGAILATTLLGAGFGSLVSGLVASDIPNHELESFQEGINDGQILLILDVPTTRVDEMIELIKTHHPEAVVSTVKPTKDS